MHVKSRPTYLQIFYKNLLAELTSFLRYVSIFLIVVAAIFIWVLEFPVVLMVVGVVVPRFLMYHLFSFFTLLPIVLVLIFAFLPIRIAMPIFFLCFLAMFVV